MKTRILFLLISILPATLSASWLDCFVCFQKKRSYQIHPVIAEPVWRNRPVNIIHTPSIPTFDQNGKPVDLASTHVIADKYQEPVGLLCQTTRSSYLMYYSPTYPPIN
jgi:hypothetical protein